MPATRPFSLKKRIQSFSYAFSGCIVMFSTQHNAWVHCVAMIGVIGAGAFFRLSRVDWCLIALAIGLVWTAEAFNTAIEFLADEVTQERSDRIQRAKDVAAFGVLASAVAALVTGCIV